MRKVVKRSVKFTRKLFLNIVFFSVLFVFLYMTATVVFNDFDYTRKNFLGYSLNYVMSGSMEPTIMTGEFVLTKTIDFEDVEVGDVIVYKHTYAEGEVAAIIHRVIEKTDDYVVTQGDNNHSRDPWNVYPEDIRFVVVKKL